VPATLAVLVALGAAVVVRRANPEPFELTTIEDATGDLLGYVGSYLLPVVIDATASTERVVIAALALALIVQLHIATGRVHVNPLLSLFGYRTYRARTANGVAYYLFARSDPALWPARVACRSLGDAILVEAPPSRRRRDHP
jgi:hypothetical protein